MFCDNKSGCRSGQRCDLYTFFDVDKNKEVSFKSIGRCMRLTAPKLNEIQLGNQKLGWRVFKILKDPHHCFETTVSGKEQVRNTCLPGKVSAGGCECPAEMVADRSGLFNYCRLKRHFETRRCFPMEERDDCACGSHVAVARLSSKVRGLPGSERCILDACLNDPMSKRRLSGATRNLEKDCCACNPKNGIFPVFMGKDESKIPVSCLRVFEENQDSVEFIESALFMPEGVMCKIRFTPGAREVTSLFYSAQRSMKSHFDIQLYWPYVSFNAFPQSAVYGRVAVFGQNQKKYSFFDVSHLRQKTSASFADIVFDIDWKFSIAKIRKVEIHLQSPAIEFSRGMPNNGDNLTVQVEFVYTARGHTHSQKHQFRKIEKFERRWKSVLLLPLARDVEGFVTISEGCKHSDLSQNPLNCIIFTDKGLHDPLAIERGLNPVIESGSAREIFATVHLMPIPGMCHDDDMMQSASLPIELARLT
ncbi:hypothetical protein HDE_12484 [Halotydeus destructor]|nr:hypothetical protein HDE_12484 [Halotydeus destructor]